MDLLILVVLVVVFVLQLVTLSLFKKCVELMAAPMKEIQKVGSLFGDFNNKKEV